MTSNLQPTSSSDVTLPLTPTALSEAEAALIYNEALQTSSAGRPQPTTPQRLPSNNYICAASNLGIRPSAPHPPSLQAQESIESATSVGHEDDAAVPPLSRGTTRIVLEKMASPDFGSELGKRFRREGQRITSSNPIKSTEENVTADDGDDDEKVVKPTFNRQQSWSQQDMKRVMTERLMGPVGEEDGGYSSAGGGT